MGLNGTGINWRNKTVIYLPRTILLLYI